MDLSTFYEGLVEKLAEFDRFVRRYGLEDRLVADHVGYKCSSNEEYRELRKLLGSSDEVFDTSFISGREITYFELRMPLHTACGPINYFELSDQKPDQSQHSHFDHIEAVPDHETPEELGIYIESRGVHVANNKRPHHPTKDIHVAPNFKLSIEMERLVASITRKRLAAI